MHIIPLTWPQISERGYFPEVDDKELELVLFRAQVRV